MKRLVILFCLIMSFVSISFAQETLYRIQKNGLYGFIDKGGNTIIEPSYKYVGSFSNCGLACVISSMHMTRDSVVHVKYGYINTNNELIVDTVYTMSIRRDNVFLSDVYLPKVVNAYNTHKLTFEQGVLNELSCVDDRFIFQDPNTKLFGFKNSYNQTVIEAKFQSARRFVNGMALVVSMKIGSEANAMLNSMGAIDINGKMTVPAEYVFMQNFRNGKTWAASLIMVKNNKGKNEPKMDWVLLDKTGKIICGPTGSYTYVFYSSNCDVYRLKLNYGSFGTYYTFVDEDGKILTDWNGDNLLSFINGNETFAYADDIQQGFARVKISNESRWKFVDKSMKQVSDLYEDACSFSGGLAAVKGLYNCYWGYVNTKFDLVIPFKFSYAGPFYNGLAYFMQEGDGYNIEGYINTKGERVWQTKRYK